MGTPWVVCVKTDRYMQVPRRRMYLRWAYDKLEKNRLAGAEKRISKTTIQNFGTLVKLGGVRAKRGYDGGGGGDGG